MPCGEPAERRWQGAARLQLRGHGVLGEAPVLGCRYCLTGKAFFAARNKHSLLVVCSAIMQVISYKAPAWSHINEVPQSWSGLYTAHDMRCSHTAQIYRR